MKSRIINIIVILSMTLSLFASAVPVKAQVDPFPSPDADGDALLNDLETAGWYNLAGGPFKTDPRDLDSDNDGLTDGEEKLFDTNPVDSHNPGIAVKYDSSFNTLQYFRTTDPAYLSIKQSGDQYLMTEAVVARRGNTFTIAGPASGTLTLTGMPGMVAMTTITPVRDPARGGWTITLPAAGTTGTYIATLTDGAWTQSMPVYVIFELPTDMPQDQIDAYLYDGDPANKRDEVAVWWRMGYWNYYGEFQTTVQPCPAADPNTPCSLWPYHLGYGMAQAYWTEQFTKSAFVDHAIKAIHGKNTLAAAVPAIASWTDVEFYTHAGGYQNNWSSSIYRYFDGIGWTMQGGDCESTATTFTTLLRSAGIPSRPFAVDYVQTEGHGDPTWLLTQNFEYDHSSMVWINGQWYAQRAYGADELTVDKYYPFNSGTTALQTWTTVGRSGGTWYYNDNYGDVLVAVNEDWDFQNNSNGGGTVNTVWPVVTEEFSYVNRDYQWESKKPLQIMQSPHVEVYNFSNWFGDNWANTEWRTPVVSNPATPARDETLTYVLPVGVPDLATPLENFPYNPQITSCSSATTTAECNALKASNNLINLYITQSMGGVISASPTLASYEAGSTVVITAAPAIGYIFGAWTGACAGQANPCTLIMSSNRTVGATFTVIEGSPAAGGALTEATVDGSDLGLPTSEASTATLLPSSGEEGTDFSDTPLFELDEQTNQDIQFGNILKDYGLDTDQNGKFDQLMVEVEVTSTVKGDYLVAGQLLAGEKTFRGGGSITLDIGKQTVALAFDGLAIGNNQAKGPYKVQALWIAEKDQIVGPYYLPDVMEAFQIVSYETNRYRAAEFEVTAALFADSFSHLGVDKNRNGEYEAITVDVGLNIIVPGAFLVEGDLFDGQGNYVSHAEWTGNKDVASLTFDVAKSQPPYTLGNLVLISKKGGLNGPMVDSRTYKAYEITDMEGRIEGGAVEFASIETPSIMTADSGMTDSINVLEVQPVADAFTITPIDTNGNGLYDKLRVNVAVTADASDILGNYRIEALLEDEYNTEVAWAVSGNQPIVPGITQTMTLEFDGKMLYDQLPLTGERALKLVAVKIFSGNLSTATLESKLEYALTTPAYSRSQFEPSTTALTVFQDDMENGSDQWALTEANVTGGTVTYRVNIGAAVGGTFTLTVDSKTTTPIAWNITAANLLTALINAGVTNVTTVTGLGTLASPWVITFAKHPTAVAMDKTGLIENVIKSTGTAYNVNIGYAVGGTFTLTVDSQTTALLAWNVSSTNLRTALTAAGISTTAVTGTGALATPWVITFTAAPAAVTMDKTGLIENVIGADAIYRVNIGAAIGGTFTLTVDSVTTAPIDYNTLPATVMATLTNAGVAVSTVTGTGALATPWVITFAAPPAAVTMDKTGLIENAIGALKIYKVNIGSATGGTFTLTVDSKTIAPVAWNITNTNLKTALTNAGLAVTNVTGSGTLATPWVITFTAAPTAVTMDKTGLIENVIGTGTSYKVNVGYAVSGTFTLTVDSKTTAPVAWNITYTDLKTALTNAGIAVSTVTGTGTYASPWVITFTAAPTVVTMDKTGLIENVIGTGTSYKVNIANAIGGTFTLMVDSKTTEPVAWNITYTNLKTALTNADIAVSNVTGSGTLAAPWVITFTAVPTAVTMDKTGLIVNVSGGNKTYFVNIGAAMGGTFTLTVDSKTTAPIDWNALPAAVLSALTNAGVAVSTVTGSGTSFSPWLITFNGIPTDVTMDKTGLIMASNGGFLGWTASTTINNVTQQLAMATPLDLTDYAAPVLRFNNAYQLGNVSDKAILEVSTDGSTWTALKTFTGVSTTPHWMVEDIDLSAYGETANVYLRFNVQRANATGYVYWYVDDVTINAWPAVKTVSITPPAIVDEGVPATFTAAYTSINTSLPVTYKWSYAGLEFVTASPTYDLVFPDAGEIPVTLTISNPYDSTSVTQTVTVGGNSDNVVLTTLVTPAAGGSVTRDPNLQAFVPGTEVTLTAIPAAGYTFTDWTGACAWLGNPCTLTINADTTTTATFTAIEYTLTIASVGPGSVTKAPDKATYHYGEVVQLTAVPEPTYGFSQWEGDLTGSANPASITIVGNASVTAKFTQGYTLAVDTIGSGTVTKYPDQATYLPGQQVTLTAFPGTNWEFSAWSGACTGSDVCVITMNRSDFVTATFIPKQFTLDVYVLPVGGTTSTVIKDPDQATYSYGQRVVLTPNPQLGWYFTSWGRDLTGSVNPSVITIDGNKTVYATFATSYSFPAATISPTGAGTVTKSPNATAYNYGTVVTVTAAPAAGWVFDHWGDSCTGSVNPCVVTVDGAESVTAYFINPAYSNVLTIEKTVGGTVTPNPTGGSYPDGTVVTLTAAPTTGYTFGEWNGDCAGQANPCSLTMDGSKSVSATFIATTFTLTISYNPAGGGTTTPEAGVITYPYGTVVNVFANPATGYKFGSWTGSCTGTANCSLTMTANRTVTANFIPVNHNLTIAVDPAVGGTTSPAVGTYSYLEGSVVEVTATPIDGYEFAEWNGACTGIGGCTVTMDMPKTVTAIFAKDLEYLTVDLTGSGVVIQDPPPPYHHGDEVTLTFDPDFNWEFSNWGGACAGQGNPCTLTMDSDKTVSAPFVQNLCALPQDLIGDAGTLREDFESMAGWTVTGSQTGYSATINTTDFKVGNSSVKLTPPTVYGYVRMIKTVNWDMSAPGEQGNFRFWVYVHGTGEPVDFSIAMSNNQQYSNSFVTWYNSSYKFQYRPGWNLINLKTSDWRVLAGSPSWNNPIVSIRITVNGTSATSFSIDGLTSGVSGVPAVVLTFDDGHSTLWDQAYAYMEPRNVRGTSYIVTDWVDTIDRVTWAQLQEIYATGWTVGNHTAAHTYLDRLSLSGQEDALDAARDALNAHGLMNVDYVAYPWGVYNADTMTAMANLGMHSGRTILNFNNVSPLTNPYLIAQRSIGLATTWATTQGYIDSTASRGEILVLTLHDIRTNPTSAGMTPTQFQDLVNYIISQGIPVITMDDLYELQSGDIAVPRPINGSCWYGSAQSEFTLSYTAGTGGTLTGETTQVVNYGEDGTAVTAVPNTGYHFENWSDGSTANPRTDTNVIADITVTANFAIKTYTITASAGTGGSITPSGAVMVTEGNDQSFTITPDLGYHIADVLVDGVSVGAVTSYTFEAVTTDHTIAASFEIIPLMEYTITASAGANGSITPSGAVTITEGNDQVFTITPDLGYHIADVLVDGTSVGAVTSYTFNDVAANHTIAASFALNTYTITASAGENGTISPSGAVIINYGADQLFTITPSVGYHVADVLVDGVSVGAVESYTFNDVAANHTIAVSFAIDTFTITASAGTGGSIDPSGAVSVNYGADQAFTISANTGYHILDVLVDGVSVGALASYTFNDVSANHTIAASFTINAYTLTVDQPTGGAITPPTADYDYGTVVILTATPDEGYHLLEWTGVCTGSGACSVTMDANKTVSAVFAINTFTLTYTAGTGGTITGESPQTVSYGEDGTLVTAVPDTGYHFVDWSDGVLTAARTDLDVVANLSVTANFALNTYTITASAGENGTISPSGTVRVDYGAVQSFTITPDLGYHVADVLVDGTSVGAVTSYTFNDVAANHTIAASFALNTYTITASAGTNGSIDPSGTVSVDYGADQSFTITPSMGYHVEDMLVDGVSVGAVTSYPFTNVTANHTIVASFALNTYTITATAGENGTITPSGAVNVNYGADQSFSISSNTGYHVADVLVDGVSVGAVTSYTFNDVSANHTIATSFAINTYTITASASSNGSIDPSGAVSVDYGQDQAFTITPSTGYHVLDILVDGVSVGAVTSYSFEAVSADHTIAASFAINTYTIAASAGTNGSIDPSGAVIVNYGADQLFTITPSVGYHVADVLVDGASVGALASYTFTNVTANHTIAASFAINTYTIMATAGENGTITPSGAVSVNYGADQAFTISANTGYHILDVLVDGVSVGTLASYTFNDVSTNHTIAASFEINTYTITATAGAGGTISPAGAVSVNYGADQAFTITPSTGYHVADMLVDGVSVGAVESYTFNDVSTNHTIAASFAVNTYTITASAGTNGSISPSGAVPVDYGADQAFTITANTGFHVADVLVDGVSMGALESYTFNDVSTNHTIAASFAINTYTLTVTQSSGGAITPPTNVYDYGTVVNLTATPDEGYHFVEWTGACTGSEACSVTMDANKTVSAVFAINTYTLTVVQPTGGAITPPTATYDYGTVVNLTATADTGYHFVEWTGACTGSGACSVTMDADKTVSAVFALDVVTLTINQSTGGTITATPAGPYHYGDVVTVEAVADTGYSFTGWTGDLTGMFNPTTITLNGDKTVGATYAIGVYTLTVVQPTGGAITPPTATYDYGTVVNLTETANTGYHFVEWTGACTGSGTCSVTMDADKTVSAVFALNTYTITATAGENGTITPSGAVRVNYGTDQAFTITPSVGYHVLDILVDGVSVGAVDSYTFEDVAADHTIAASFALNTYTITATAGAGGTITPSGEVSVDYGQGQIFTITPDLGYHVLDVLVDGTTVGAVTNHTFTNVQADHTITASFAIDTFIITASAGAGGSIDPSGAVSVDYGTDKIFNILPNPGYHVLDVLVDGVSMGAVASYTFVDVTASHTIAASFAINTFTISASAGTNGSIDPYGEVSVNYGADQDFSITPDLGYHVLDVLVDGVSMGAVTSYTFSNVQADHTIAASFEINTYTITITAGENGAISPSGVVSVNYGADQSFTITANTGYHVEDVLVDGASVGAVESYTFTNVIADHTIAASFELTLPNTYTITATAGSGGSIDPLGEVTVTEGYDQTFTITPDLDYQVADVLVDGVSMGAVASYTFENVAADHTITASFEETPPNTYTITATAGSDGSIDPSGSVTVTEGNDQSFSITANADYHVLDVLVDGTSVGAVASYTFNDVSANHTIVASFAINTYTISASAGTGGSISPSGAVSVNYGANQIFTITPDLGYHILDVLVDGASMGVVESYTFSNVQADHTIAASFELTPPNTYTITATAGTGGSITPLGDVMVTEGTGQSFTITANTGYHILDVLVDGDSVGTVTNYTFTNVQADHTIEASFAIDTFTITASAGTSGSISPSGAVNVNYGADQTFSISPNLGYHILDVLVDSVSVGAVASYTFYDVTANHTIAASFAINTYTITASAGTGGTISPSGAVSVDYGGDQSFTISPNLGYHILDVLVDGVSVGVVSSYTFYDVSANHTISAIFASAEMVTLTVIQPDGGAIDPISGDYPMGTQITLTATPDLGYVFFHWTDGTPLNIIGYQNQLVITLKGYTTVSAYFQLGTLREPFDTLTGFVAKGKGTYALETSNYIEGLGALRLTMPTKAGYEQVTKTVAWDLSSTYEQGNLRFWLYVSDKTKLSSFEILLANDSAIRNYYLATISPASLNNGWNLVEVSNWVPVGKPTWTKPIIRVIYRGYGAGAYYLLDGLTSGGTQVTGMSATFQTIDTGRIEKSVDIQVEDLWFPQ